MIIIEPRRGKSIVEYPVEIVEQKGAGHPDYLCDSILDRPQLAAVQVVLERGRKIRAGVFDHKPVLHGVEQK